MWYLRDMLTFPKSSLSNHILTISLEFYELYSGSSILNYQIDYAFISTHG